MQGWRAEHANVCAIAAANDAYT